MTLLAGISHYIATKLRAGRPSNRSLIPNSGKRFFEAGSGAHQAFYPIGTVGSFPGVKRQGYEVDRSSSFSAEVNT